MKNIPSILDGLLADDKADSDTRELASFASGLLAVIPDIVFEVDDKGTYLNIWTTDQELLAASEESLLGKRVDEVLSQDQAEQALHALKMAARNDTHRGEVIPITTQNGEERWFEHSFARKKNMASGRDDTFLVLSHDVSRLKLAEQAYKDKYRLLQTILQATPDMVWLKDSQGVYLFCNSAFARLVGQFETDIIGKKAGELFAQDAASAIQKTDCITVSTGSIHASEEQITCAETGQKLSLEIHKYPLFDESGNVEGVLGIGRDMTQHKRLQQELIRHEHEFRTLVENSPDLIARFDPEYRHLYVNPALANLLGGAEAFLGKTLSEVNLPKSVPVARYEHYLSQVFATGESQEFELHWNQSDHDHIHQLIRLTPERTPEGEIASVLMVGRDITELYQSRERVQRMELYDGLTGLPNRVLFEERVQQAITKAEYHGKLMVVMMLDLDNLKVINESLSHSKGDRLLQEVGKRLKAVLRAYDTVARFGGDEFSILLPQVRGEEDISAIADKLLGVFGTPFLLDDRELFVTCSLGIALCPTDSITSSDLLKYADSAMYLAKGNGGNGYSFYSATLTKNAQQRLTLEQELRKAVQLNQLELYFQPKVELETGCLAGAEALLRWRHPELGLVPPDDFIPMAEETGLIIPIGQWVLDQAARIARKWNQGREQPLKIAVNISISQVRFSDLLTTIRQTLAHRNCKPQWLELEVTESLLLNNDGETQSTLSDIAKLGITIAIDDFGTGYSALSYLHQFAIDSLKVDRQFICELEQSPRKRELLKAIVVIANAFELELVAEGIETTAQADLLAELGCPLGQGYLFGRPVPVETFRQQWFGADKQRLEEDFTTKGALVSQALR